MLLVLVAETMQPIRRDASPHVVDEPRCSKFCEDFDAPFIESIVAPTTTPSTETEDAKSDPSSQAGTSQNRHSHFTILGPSRISSWTSGSRVSAASAALKRWKSCPLKKLKNSANKLWRSEKSYYAGFDDSGWPRN